jgi:hypothetical protein
MSDIAISAAASPAPSFRHDLKGLWRTLTGLFDSYRPERHYMRGPGPKWRQKHAHDAVKGELPALRTLRAA